MDMYSYMYIYTYTYIHMLKTLLAVESTRSWRHTISCQALRYTYRYVYIFGCMHARIVYAHLCCFKCVHTLHICTYIYILHVCVEVCTCVRIHVYMYVCTHARIRWMYYLHALKRNCITICKTTRDILESSMTTLLFRCWIRVSETLWHNLWVTGMNCPQKNIARQTGTWKHCSMTFLKAPAKLKSNLLVQNIRQSCLHVQTLDARK